MCFNFPPYPASKTDTALRAEAPTIARLLPQLHSIPLPDAPKPYTEGLQRQAITRVRPAPGAATVPKQQEKQANRRVEEQAAQGVQSLTVATTNPGSPEQGEQRAAERTAPTESVASNAAFGNHQGEPEGQPLDLSLVEWTQRSLSLA